MSVLNFWSNLLAFVKYIFPLGTKIIFDNRIQLSRMQKKDKKIQLSESTLIAFDLDGKKYLSTNHSSNRMLLYSCRRSSLFRRQNFLLCFFFSLNLFSSRRIRLTPFPFRGILKHLLNGFLDTL